MLLYHDPRAPNPRRVRIFLAEKGVTVDTIEVSIAAQANRAETYLTKHPLGLLPILELEDGRVLRESMAICRYIEELHPEPNLLGTDAWERAVIDEWSRHAEFEILFPVAQTFRNTHPFWVGRLKQAPEFGAIMKDLTYERMAWLDRELAQRPYLAGPRFTVADITLLCGLEFGKIVDVRLSDAFPNLVRWHAEVKARPSYKA